MLSSLEALGANDGRHLNSLRKFLIVVGWVVNSVSGARASLLTEKCSISRSICCTFLYFVDSLVQPEHMFRPVRQYIVRIPVPWAFRRRHLVARQGLRC